MPLEVAGTCRTLPSSMAGGKPDEDYMSPSTVDLPALLDSVPNERGPTRSSSCLPTLNADRTDVRVHQDAAQGRQ